MDMYLFQDRETVKKIWKQRSLSSPISIYIYVLKYFFGLPESALSVYRADDSGPLPKPYSHSHVQPQDRVDHITHHPYLRALSGPGLSPTVERFKQSLEKRVVAMHWGDEWTEESNIESLFQRVPAASLIEAIFGPTLLHLNPSFVENIWKFDNFVPWFARAIPGFLMPEPYRLRERLKGQLKHWYQYARQRFQESDISEDGDGDPFWGSELIRHRQKVLLQVQHHDDNVLASTDIGLVWG
ncbi:cytochrome p450 [Hirsutella rhossiliensis]